MQDQQYSQQQQFQNPNMMEPSMVNQNAQFTQNATPNNIYNNNNQPNNPMMDQDYNNNNFNNQNGFNNNNNFNNQNGFNNNNNFNNQNAFNNNNNYSDPNSFNNNNNFNNQNHQNGYNMNNNNNMQNNQNYNMNMNFNQPQQQQNYNQFNQNNQNVKMGQVMPVQPDAMNIGINNNNQIIQNDDELNAMRGIQKLENVKKLWVIPDQQNGWNDMLCGGSYYIRYLISTPPDPQKKSGTPLFYVNFNPPNCGEDNIPGKFNSINYTSSGDIDQENIYDLNHDRACCALKCTTAFCCIVGMIFFYIISCIIPSKSYIRKGGELINSLRFGCMADNTQILDSSGNLKYTIKSNYENSKEIIPKQVFTNDGILVSSIEILPIKQKEGFYYYSITFSKNLNPDDKAAIILAICKLQ